MTNQQLKAHCEDVIANPQDHSEMVLAMAKALLPCLEAEPVVWIKPNSLGVPRMAEIDAVTIPYVPEYPVELFATPPVPQLKLPDPINWKEAHSRLIVNQCGEDRFEAFRMGANWQLGEIKRLNGVTS